MSGPADLDGSDFPTDNMQGGLESTVGSGSQDIGVDAALIDEDGGTGEAGLSRNPEFGADAPVHDVSERKTGEVP